MSTKRFNCSEYVFMGCTLGWCRLECVTSWWKIVALIYFCAHVKWDALAQRTHHCSFGENWIWPEYKALNMNMMSSVVCRVCFGWNRKLQAYQMLFSEICTKYVRSDIFVDSFIIILAHLNYSLVRLRTVCVRVCVYRCHVAGALWATAKANRTQW